MLSELKESGKVVGAKQVRRALTDGRARTVFVALDADSRITEPVLELARQQSVPVQQVASMKELGSACSVAVGSAVAALLAQ